MMEDFLAKGVSSLIVIAIAIFLLLFLLNMLADCLRRPFKKPAHKMLWFFFIVFFQAIGAFIYWLAVYRKS